MSEFTVLHISLVDLNQPDNCIHAHYKTKGDGHWSSDNTKTIESGLCIQQKSFARTKYEYKLNAIKIIYIIT